jgi:hypothetical protein
MRHPTEGVLRRLLDEPAGVADADRGHVADCPVCLVALAQAREDAAAVDGALRPERTADADVDAAWARMSTSLSTRSAAEGRGRAATPPPVGRSRAVLRRPVIAALAFALVLTGAGVAAANDWLQIFHTERIAPISVSASDLVALPDLTAYGDVETTGRGDPHAVADAAAAHEATGLDVPEVADLPRGVNGDPAYQVVGEVSAIFTFSADRAAAAAPGQTLPALPPGLDGSRIRLVAGPGLAEVWSHRSGMPGLVVGRAVAPKAYSSGVSFERVRDYLLSLPGLPQDLAAQLRKFTADGSTLPLLVPSDKATTSSTDVHGRPATVVESRDKSLAAVVWVKDGVVTAVAGALSADEVVSVARALR